jgi:phenylacetate-CoA oxygenase, PaaI subunit
MLDPYLREALVGKLTALADDEVVLAQRLSEWVAHAPILEEDIAIANLAQDELGHAKLYLELRQELDGSDPDQVVFLRDPLDYGNAVLVELPRGDWAFTMVRQYLFDAYEGLWLREAASSRYAPLAEVAARILKEERFHLRHSSLWVERLALGPRSPTGGPRRPWTSSSPTPASSSAPWRGRRPWWRRGSCRTSRPWKAPTWRRWEAS